MAMNTHAKLPILLESAAGCEKAVHFRLVPIRLVRLRARGCGGKRSWLSASGRTSRFQPR